MITNHVQKIGNSLGVHIPKAVAQEAGLTQGTPVSISYSKDRIIITPQKQTTSLNDLLCQIDSHNQHDRVDFGTDVGKEQITW